MIYSYHDRQNHANVLLYYLWYPMILPRFELKDSELTGSQRLKDKILLSKDSVA